MSRPRVESNYAAHDYASIRNEKRLQKYLDQEEILFSDEVTKTNHIGRRQIRVLILTSEALYNFKRNHYQKPQRKMLLEQVETIFISVESSVDLLLKVKETDNLLLEMSRRSTFVKALQNAIRSKLGKDVEKLEVPQGLLIQAWKDKGMTSQKVKQRQELLSAHSTFGSVLDGIKEDEEREASTGSADASPPSPSKFGLIRKSLIAGAPIISKKRDSQAAADLAKKKELKAKRALPEVPARKGAVNNIMRRVSAQTIKYFPKCPPCRVPIGVVQPIWSLMERALEPLIEEAKPPAGLVRCADILYKLVGDNGPVNEAEAMKSIAALCFDKDAARALLQSLSDNVPVLGGSALIDSLDALQRCEDPVVRSWAVKSLWKILPLCMLENALPITSTKWMLALQGPLGDDAANVNQGETWFLKTYFRGMIKFGAHEKEPLRRIAKRKGSFSVLGGGVRNSANFPGGLTPLIVQQAFSQVLLQNLFDVQRRAAYAMNAKKNSNVQSREGSSSIVSKLQEERAGGNSHIGGYDDDSVVCGVVEADCTVVLELLLNSLTRPHDPDRKIEVTGKRICNTMLLPTLMGMLVLVDEDSVRQTVLKDVSLLLLRSETNLKAVLDIPDWQLLFVPLLQTVPRDEKMRTAEQRILHKYVLNLLTMIHTYCFKEPNCQGGPLGSMLTQTFHALAMFGDWTPDTVGVGRWILFGLLTQLSMTARHWWHDGDAPEWSAFAQLIRAIEDFIFFLPDNGVKAQSLEAPTAKDVAGRALIKSGGNMNSGGNVNALESFSEEDSDSDDEGGKEGLRKIGRRRKRQFSITPVYELKGFDPVVRPLSPEDSLKMTSEFDWMLSRSGEFSENLPDRKGSNLRSGAQQEPEVPRRVGLHLNENGTSNDIKLVEMVIELLKRMGITGNPPEDLRRGEVLKNASKKEKGLLKSASEWCKAFMTIRELLVDLDLAVELNNQDALKNTMQRIAQLIESRHTVSKASTAKLSLAQTKAVATKLEASVLKQRQLAKQKLTAHTVAEPVKISDAITVLANPQTAQQEVMKMQNAAARALAKSQGRGRHNTHNSRASSIVSRTRFYSSVTEDDTRSETGPNVHDKLPALGEEVQNLRRPSKMNKRFSFKIEDNLTATVEEEEDFEELEDGPPCDECGAPVSDEFDAVHQYDFTYHSDCFACDECHLPLLKSENPTENNVFFNDTEFKKYCGAECRITNLNKGGEDICPGCMCFFVKGEKALRSCGRLWHVHHLRCQDCKQVLGAHGKEHFPVEIEAGEVWPFCTTCHSKRFRTCAKCVQPIQNKDDAVDALGRVYHREHFNCFRCGESFKGKEFYVDGHGDAARALCEACWNHSNSPRIICDSCGKVLGDKDDAVELDGKLFHAKTCFKCVNCNTTLAPGEVFEGENSTPLCDTCFYNKKGYKCAACTKIITSEVLHAEQKTWHPSCFSCRECDGLPLSGRYIMTDQPDGKRLPICESHWMQKNAQTCKSCSLPMTTEILTLGNDKYHPACLVCHYCTQPLATAKGAHSLNQGPDGNWYCDKHADGVCAYTDCKQSCWGDGKLYKTAEEPCASCGDAIRDGDGLNANGKWYHIPAVSQCFICLACGEPFYENDEYTTIPGTSDPVHKTCLKM